VSFNLSMSAEEQAAKSKVQLPYMHQGQQVATEGSASAGTSGANLFFIDEDDPDWDDDDLDDDLDI
jgi:elongator complex protein 5